MNWCEEHNRHHPCHECEAVTLRADNARLAALVESQRSIMLRIAAHVTPIRDADQEQQHANDVAATMDRLDELDDIVNSRVCDLECDAAQAESRAEWYALLARAVKADRLDWDEAEGFSWAGDDDLGDECEFKDGLPVETPELRAALEAALNQNRMPQ